MTINEIKRRLDASASVETDKPCEGVAPDALLTEKCRQEGISLLTTSLGVYEACVRLAA